MTVPYWVEDAIFYQIFPDRFANGDMHNDPADLQPWGSPPTSWGFQGGDLRGIIDKFDYLLDLGVNAIYLNPIFLANSNHRYNTVDYFKIDPRVGTLEDFHALLEVAHSNNVRVVLDGVFNHCGRGFFAFSDILENQEHSVYRNWFHIKKFPVDAYSPGKAEEYEAWWGFKGMPKFNTNNPAVRRYLLSIARYWIEQGADGWRLDVPNEIDDDSFWLEFRNTVKAVNRDAYLVGEIWTVDPRWVGPNHFDGLMDYPVRDAVLDFLNGGFLTAAGFADQVEGVLKRYPHENAYAMYVPLGSHDTERIYTRFNGNLDKLKLAYAFIFAYPGAPAIYYGDEIGMAGGKDPECRAAFNWNSETWLEELHGWLRTLISLRKKHATLRRGVYRRILADEKRNVYAFARTLGDKAVLIVLNASAVRRHLRLPIKDLGWKDGLILHNLLGFEEYIVSGDFLVVSVPPCGGVWIG
ncbi:MAG: glycoside hydrolase family 13 protein [Anaerolineales bacterium]|jgi:cyclomaltodextrinase